MSKEIFFATENQYKKERFESYLKPLELEIVSPITKLEVVEDGTTPEENAIKKATAGYLASGIPSIGVDYWLAIKGFPEAEQPGPYVRRIFTGKDGQRKEATDEEMLDYYIKRLEDIGGRAKGIWTSAIALVVDPDRVFSETFTTKTLFTSVRSPKLNPGEPLNSIQRDAASCIFLSELSIEEWQERTAKDQKGYVDFMKKHLGEILG